MSWKKTWGGKKHFVNISYFTRPNIDESKLFKEYQNLNTWQRNIISEKLMNVQFYILKQWLAIIKRPSNSENKEK